MMFVGASSHYEYARDTPLTSAITSPCELFEGSGERCGVERGDDIPVTRHSPGQWIAHDPSSDGYVEGEVLQLKGFRFDAGSIL
jgi:hypothetical protein